MNDVIPIHYVVRIAPDLETLVFQGRITLTARANVPATNLVLHALSLDIHACHLETNGSRVPCALLPDPTAETIRIDFQQSISGDFRLDIAYAGSINDKMAGFYRSRQVRGTTVRTLALTQFEESAARMALPCVDHPAAKATFDVVMVVDASLQAVSNGEIVSETELDDGKKQVVFETTPRMSPYLLFFGVGDFRWAACETDRRVRAAAMPGGEGQLAAGLDYGEKSLRYCEDYFGIPYPMTKLDLIAVPDFAFGAMENWGAVVFRENLLLLDPEKTSQAGRERIFEVIAHEIVHQWFGNLVGPSDWKYLWLNESFATFFANRVVDHYCPEWQTWEQFLHTQTSVAMRRDALWETPAIEIPGGEHVVINAATAPIIYNKGAGILYQMAGYVGETHFHAGIRHYLKTHAYACAESRHLWEAYEAVSDKPVTTLMKGWVGRPGFPLLNVTREGDALVIRQERFTYLPAACGGPVSDSGPVAPWPVPLRLEVFQENGASKAFDLLMDKQEAMLHLGAGTVAVKLNAGQKGFYRVHYLDDDMLEALAMQVADRTLCAADRWGLQEDLFALVRAGRASLESYLDFLCAYRAEDGFLPLMGIADNLRLAALVVDGARRERVLSFAAPFLETVLGRIGFEPLEKEANTTRMLRDALLFRAVLFGSKTARAWGAERFRRLMDGGWIHPDVQRSVLRIGAWQLPGQALPWLQKRFGTTDSEHERMNILTALGSLGNRREMEAALSFTLQEVPQRNRHLPLVACAANPAAVGWLWHWVTAHMPDLDSFHPLLLERVIDAVVPICGLGQEASVRSFFGDDPSRTKAGGAAVRIALAFLAVNERMRKAG